MAANMTIFPAGTRRRVAQAVASAAVGARGAAGCAALLSEIGSNPRLRIRNGATIVADMVFQGLLTATSGVITLPQYATLNTLIDATVGAGWVARLGRADDSVYVEGPVGNAASSAPFKLSNNPDDNKGLVVAGLSMRFDPAIDGASTASIISTIVDHMGTHPFVLNSAPVGPTWPISAAVIKGADLRSIAVPSWWGYNPRTDLGAYWTNLIPWFVLWDIVGHQAGLNVRAAFRDCQLWVLHDDDNSWVRTSNVATPGGNAYERNMINPVPGTLDNRVEIDGSSSVRFDPSSPYAWHGYGTWGLTTRPDRVRAIVGRVQARKILHDPSGPDQRAQARYSVHVGADAYPLPQNPNQFGEGAYNPGLALGRNVELTNDWQWIYMANLSTAASVDTAYPYNFRQTITEALLSANPPPIS